ncbi:MAG: hypothetical protein ACAI25_02060 [Planctomycetota bacterium]
MAALALGLALVALALWANAVAARPASLCPAEGGVFSCAALVRPPLEALGPVTIAPLVLLGAATEALAALLLAARAPRTSFARDVAILAALGAGAALGLQPLALLVVGRACLACLLVLASQLVLALVLAKVAKGAGAPLRPAALAFVVALLGTGALATAQGRAQRRADEDARAALARVERDAARVVLVEKPGCPFCETLRLDVLARPEVLARLAKTGLAHREPAPGEPAPILIARDATGREGARALGGAPTPDELEAVLQAAER